MPPARPVPVPTFASPDGGEAGPVLELRHVDLIRNGRHILHRIDWRISPGERWVLLGPNGSGKTSLCRVASLYQHPSRGTVDLLGHRLGRVDVRQLRTHLGFTGAAVADMLSPRLRVSDVVITGKHAALAACWHDYTANDHARAIHLLDRFGCRSVADARFGTLSSGERQRVLLARTLMSRPSLLLLDEPTAGLDLGGREDLVRRLTALARDPDLGAIVLVTHHVDEIPPDFTHALLIREGRVVSAGPLPATMTRDRLSACFGIELDLERRHGRWMAWGA